MDPRYSNSNLDDKNVLSIRFSKPIIYCNGRYMSNCRCYRCKRVRKLSFVSLIKSDYPWSRGVGFGVCQRLIFNLTTRICPDSLPQPTSPYENLIEPPHPDSFRSLKLIMACRSVKRGELARIELLKSLEGHIHKLKSSPHYDGKAEEFQANLEIEVVELDLSRISNVLRFAQHVKLRYTRTRNESKTINSHVGRYPYVSHLIFNAGVAPFRGLNWPLAIYEICTNLVNAITKPVYYLQDVGKFSPDGLGLVWQSNVFGHYVLVSA